MLLGRLQDGEAVALEVARPEEERPPGVGAPLGGVLVAVVAKDLVVQLLGLLFGPRRLPLDEEDHLLEEHHLGVGFEEAPSSRAGAPLAAGLERDVIAPLAQGLRHPPPVGVLYPRQPPRHPHQPDVDVVGGDQMPRAVGVQGAGYASEGLSRMTLKPSRVSSQAVPTPLRSVRLVR